MTRTLTILSSCWRIPLGLIIGVVGLVGCGLLAICFKVWELFEKKTKPIPKPDWGENKFNAYGQN